jgi:hypothetical protein
MESRFGSGRLANGIWMKSSSGRRCAANQAVAEPFVRPGTAVDRTIRMLGHAGRLVAGHRSAMPCYIVSSGAVSRSDQPPAPPKVATKARSHRGN